MSRVGKLPIHLDKSIKATVAGDMLKVEGPKGKLEIKLHPGFIAEIKDSEIVVKRPGDTSEDRAIHGLMRKLIANMVEGVGKGFTRVLEINGVGYRAEAKGQQVNLTLGYSHPIVYQLPPGVTAKVEKLVTVTLESADRQLLGTVAAQIRELRPPEPYKGKGIKYATETIRRKAGKAAAGSTSA
ncbi:MAG: 50S ribosomal protein L6 [Candidatus Binatus sp.]